MSGDKRDLYEQIIEDMIIDGIKGMTPEELDELKKMPVEDKRSMILTVLEENNVEHRLLCGKIQKFVNSGDSEMKHIKEVVQMLRKYVEVSDTEVKTMGEVMTPISLVEEMLDTLPYEVWSNPDLKWLDPCNGVGTFVSVVVERLMKGLSTFEPNEKKRYRHIMENMIYVCELQAKNVFLYMYAFDPRNEYDLNIYNGSYLVDGFDDHMKNVCWVEKFDVVVMNPPYMEQKEGNKKSQTLWDKFVIKVLEKSLIENGYLVAVHPAGWRNIDGLFKTTQELLKSKQISYLEMHSQEEGVKTFGAETRYDFYCLKNIKNNGNFTTKIKCQGGKIERADISKLEFIPNGMFDVFYKLTAKDNEEKVKLIADSSYHTQRTAQISKNCTGNYKYPCVYIVMKEKIRFWYSNSDNKGHFGESKLIWGNGRIKSVGSMLDLKGEYGLTQFTYGIVDSPNNLPKIKQAFDCDNFRKFMEFCSVGDMSINRKVIATFRKDFWVDFLK